MPALYASSSADRRDATAGTLARRVRSEISVTRVCAAFALLVAGATIPASAQVFRPAAVGLVAQSQRQALIRLTDDLDLADRLVRSPGAVLAFGMLVILFTPAAAVVVASAPLPKGVGLRGTAEALLGRWVALAVTVGAAHAMEGAIISTAGRGTPLSPWAPLFAGTALAIAYCAETRWPEIMLPRDGST